MRESAEASIYGFAQVNLIIRQINLMLEFNSKQINFNKKN